MAYLSEFGIGERQLGLRLRHAAAASFTTVEWRVIRLSARDGHASLSARAAGPLARLGAWIFGTQRPNSLADPRLEALRRFAVAQRVHGDDAPATFREALLAAGYSLAHADLVRATIGVNREGGRASGLRIGAMLLTLVALIGGLGIVARGFAAYSGDAMIGAVLGALLVVIAAPLALAPARRSL